MDQDVDMNKFLEKNHLIEILSLNDRVKSANILYESMETKEKSILVVKLDMFKANQMDSVLKESTKFQYRFKNDVYFNLDGKITTSIPITALLVSPANEKQIQRYRGSQNRIIEESYDQYINITRPYGESLAKNNQWIYNIFDKISEQERIYYRAEDPLNGFVILPDIRWKEEDKDKMYLVILSERKDILSLRDLDATCLDLLESIQTQALKLVKDKFGYDYDQVRMYIHYQPTFYHFHVHVNLTGCLEENDKVYKAHALADVIDNIKMDSFYYRKRIMRYTVQESHELYKQFHSKK